MAFFRVLGHIVVFWFFQVGKLHLSLITFFERSKNNSSFKKRKQKVSIDKTTYFPPTSIIL